MRKARLFTLFQLLAALSVLFSGCSSTPTETVNQKAEMKQAVADKVLFIGTYTQKEGHVDGKAEGIYVYAFNTETGALTHLSTSPPITNPSYLTVHPSGQWLYAVSETGGEGEKEFGFVSAFRIDQEQWKLQHINTVSSRGKYPCYISVDSAGRHAMVANYGGGVALLPLRSDGALQQPSDVVRHSGKGPSSRQESPHSHMITPGPGPFFYAVDLGTDKIYPYRINAEAGTFEPAAKPASVAPGAGPRHIRFHPNQNWGYVVNELNGTIDAFKVNAETGAMEHFQTITTIPSTTTEAAASGDIQVHPSGKYL